MIKTNINKHILSLEKENKIQTEYDYSKLSIEQINVAIDYCLNPIKCKEKAYAGTSVDLKRYFIATEAVDPDLVKIAALAVVAFGPALYRLVKELIKKILDKINSLAYRIKGYGLISDADTRLTNELLKMIPDRLPNYYKFNDLSADEIKKLYEPVVRDFLISNKIDPLDSLVDTISTRIYSIILNLKTTPSARLLAGIGDTELFNTKLYKIAALIKEKNETSAIYNCITMFSKASISKEYIMTHSVSDIIDMLLIRLSDPVPYGIEGDDLYRSTLKILRGGQAHDLFRKTYKSVTQMNNNKVLESAVNILKEINIGWAKDQRLLGDACKIIINLIPKYLASYSNTISFSSAYVAITNLITRARKEQSKLTNDNQQLIGSQV